MKKKGNQRTVGVILSYLTTGINSVVQLIYTPVMISLLGKSEYGAYQLAASIVSYLSLFDMGFSSAYVRFFSRFENDDDEDGIARLNGLFLLVFMFLMICVLLAGIVIVKNANLVFGTSISDAELSLVKKLFFLLVINLAITFPVSVFQSYIIAHEKFFFQRIIALLRCMLNPLISLPLLLMGYRSISLVLVTTFLTFVNGFTCVFYAVQVLHIRFIFTNVEFKLLKEISNFSFFVFLNMIVNELNWNTDKYVLGWFSGTAAVAMYSVGSTLNSSFMSISNTVSSVFVPKINRCVVQNDTKEINRIFIKVGRIQFMIIFLIAYGFVFLGRYFITKIYAGEGYGESYIVALLLIIPAVVPLIQNIGIEVLRAKNLHKVRSVVYLIIAIMNLALSIPLAKVWGSVGAALGTTISMLLGNGLFMNIYYQKKAGIDIMLFWKNIISFIPATIVPVIVGVVSNLIGIKSNSQFIISGIFYMVSYVVSFWLLGMNNEEKAIIRSLVRIARR